MKDEKDNFYSEPKTVWVLSAINSNNDMTIHTNRKPKTVKMAGKEYISFLSDSGDVFYINPDMQAGIIIYKRSNIAKLSEMQVRKEQKEKGGDM